jgi:hypothetical protein
MTRNIHTAVICRSRQPLPGSCRCAFLQGYCMCDQCQGTALHRLFHSATTSGLTQVVGCTCIRRPNKSNLLLSASLATALVQMPFMLCAAQAVVEHDVQRSMTDVTGWGCTVTAVQHQLHQRCRTYSQVLHDMQQKIAPPIAGSSVHSALTSSRC